MIKTIRDVRHELSSIDINKLTARQKTSYAEINNWMSDFDNDAVINSQNLKTVRKRIKNLKMIKKIRKPMNEITKSKVQALCDSMETIINNLYGRWEDEKEYEDWADYIAKLKSVFSHEIVINQMTNAVYVKVGKRPFGITFDFEGWRVTLSAKSTSYGWQAKQL